MQSCPRLSLSLEMRYTIDSYLSSRCRPHSMDQNCYECGAAGRMIKNHFTINPDFSSLLALLISSGVAKHSFPELTVTELKAISFGRSIG